MLEKKLSKKWNIVLSVFGLLALSGIVMQFTPAQALVAGMSCSIVSGGTTQNPWVICKDASGNDVENEYYNHKNIDDTKQSPLPAIGNINWGYYDSTWNYRHNVEGYPNCDACMDSTTGHYRFIAMMRGTSGKIDGDKQRKVCILRNGQTSSEGPFYVIDVVKDTDKALNIGNGWIADVDQYTSKKWNNNGGGVLGQIVNCTSEQLGGSGNNSSASSQSSSSSSSQNNNGSSGSRQFPIMVQVGTAQQNIAADFIYAWFTDGSLGYQSGNDPTQSAVDAKIGSVIAKVSGKTGNKMFMVSDKDTLKLVMDKHCEELYSAGIRYIGYDMEISPPGTEREEMDARQNTDDSNSVAIAAKLSVSCHGMKLWWGSIFANTVNINDDAMKVMMKAGLYGIAFQIQNQWDNPNGTPASQVAAAAKRYNADAAAVGVARPQYTEQVMTDGSNCISQGGTVPMATCQGAVQGLIKASLMDNLSVWAQGGSITETFLKQVLGSYYGTPSSGGGSSSSSSSSNSASQSSTANTGNGSEITSKIDTLIKNSGYSGGVFVSANHTTLLDKGYGLANRSKNVANSSSTQFRIGSLTKTFTAVAIMKLKEEGQLDLDAKICSTISCPTTNWSAVTYRQLLNNTSGIPDVEQYVGSIETKQSTPSEVIALVANKPLEFIPGNSQKYSSTGYIMLGMAIEKISGQTFDQYLKNKLFDPYNFANIGIENNDCNAGTSNLTTIGYEGNSVASCIDMSVPFSAGDMISTAGNLGIFLDKLFTNNILTSASVDILKTAAQITLTGDKYAMGMWAGKYSSNDMYYHQGRINGFGSRWTEIPAKGMTVVLLSNVNSEQNTLTGQILNILIGYVPPSSSSSSSSSSTSAIDQVTSVIPQVTAIINGVDRSSLFGPNKAHTKYDILNGNCTCNGADATCAASCAKGRYQLVISPINLPAYGTLKSIDKDMVDVWQIFCNITANSMMETEPYKSMRSKINIVCVNDLSCNNLTGCTGPAIDQTEIASTYNASHQVVIDFGVGGYSTTAKEDDVLGTNKLVSYLNVNELAVYRKVLVNHILGHGIGGLMHPGNFAPYSSVTGYTQDMFCEFRGNCESYYGVFYDGKACSKSVMTFTKDSSGNFYSEYCDSEITVLKDQITKNIK